jgi:hypothetical protein
MSKSIFESVDEYISGLFGDEDDSLRKTVEVIDEEKIPQISVSANQGNFCR